MEQLNLPVLQNHLSHLCLENVENIPTQELEWILSDFLTSWGQRLPLDPQSWPPETDRDYLRRLGLTLWPFSVADDFPAVQPRQLRALAMAAAALNLYVMFIDAVVDEPLRTPATVKLAIEGILLHFYRSSGLLFSPSSPYWDEVNRQMNLMSRVMLEEFQRTLDPVRPFSWDEFRHIACGKMTFARINAIALALLNGTPEHIPVLIDCWDAISLASIINDDTLDWREDYIKANYTYLLCQVLFSPPFQEQVRAGQLPDVAEVGAALFCTDLIESLHQRAYDELTTAAQKAEGIHCPALVHLIQRVQEKIASKQNTAFDHKVATLIAAISDNP